MTNQLSSSDMRRYAVVGAEARLAEITQEADAIRRAFPELVGNGAGRSGGQRSAPSPTAGHDESGEAAAPRRKRRGMSDAQRKAVGERMKKYWAARRGGSDGAGAATTSSANSAKSAKSGRKNSARSAKGSAKARKRTMSAAGRKRISEAQKARWAKQRKDA